MSAQPGPTGVLLLQLGTPDSTETSDVRTYLREFLSDPRVLSQSPSPSFVEVVRNAIPQYDRGHAAWMGQVESALPEGVHLTGWGYRGVGVVHSASDAVRIAGLLAAT